MTLPSGVNLVEVSPRDGLQAEQAFIPTDMKLAFIDALRAAGLHTIEATSFVSPKKIPQLKDHSAVMSALSKQTDRTKYPVLVPNLTGLERALAAGATEIAVFTSVSNTFTQKNIGVNTQQSLHNIQDILDAANAYRINVRAYISCITDCPYEGPIAATAVASIAKQLHQMGVSAISLADTLGKATPQRLLDVLSAVTDHVPIYALGLHCHDTYGQALTNIYAALHAGITTFDCSAAGLGGCPFAPGATGNVATEDVVYLLEGLGIKTGVDLPQLIQASQPVLQYLEKKTESKVAKALSK